ncbi:MAG: hypothetical protein HC866_21735 [Leptolyngbyaceae cyanobacterium RU_5_1]|nr:hypothetical protein [Leptolyngbyaceae cyanobacterium RU_5_1]
MPHISWHDYLLILSFFASIAGLILLNTDKNEAKDAIESTDRMLIMMSFTYWLVHCAAIGLQKFILPQWEFVLLSVKLTGVITYLLTASCILSLPLNRVADRQPE